MATDHNGSPPLRVNKQAETAQRHSRSVTKSKYSSVTEMCHMILSFSSHNTTQEVFFTFNYKFQQPDLLSPGLVLKKCNSFQTML